MLTEIDHTVIGLPDLAKGIEAFQRIGFDMQYGGTYPGIGTEAAFAFFDDGYLELRGIREGEDDDVEDSFAEFVQRGGGLFEIAVRSDDLVADVVAMRGRGVDVTDPVDCQLRTNDGHILSSKSAKIGSTNPLPLSFVEHQTSVEERRIHVPRFGPHPNTALHLERAYVVVTDVTAAADSYSMVLGVPVPALERGTVINSLMAVFYVGKTGVAVAEPTEPGFTSDALARRGPGPFQLLYRSRSIDAADTWIRDQGLPPPARGVRLSGEHAILVQENDAFGVYVGFAGSE